MTMLSSALFTFDFGDLAPGHRYNHMPDVATFATNRFNILTNSGGHLLLNTAELIDRGSATGLLPSP
jgi:hypothetical protein